MTINIDSLFKNADPIVSKILNNALSDKEISVKDGWHYTIQLESIFI